MKVTLDTNVLVSAFIAKKGNLSRILELIATLDEITIVLSTAILEEFEEVPIRDEIKERFGFSLDEISEFVQTIKQLASIIDARSKFRRIKDDPKDDIILNAAYDGKVDFVISGDKHLHKVKNFKGIRIVSPRQFLDIVEKTIGRPTEPE